MNAVRRGFVTAPFRLTCPAWSSDIDGPLSSGGSFSRTLNDGEHTITASVADSGSLTTSNALTIMVGGGGGKGWGKGGKPR